MNTTVQNLVDKANTITSKMGSSPGVRYPNELKQIVRSLVVDHQIPISKVCSLTDVSQYSVRKWAYEPFSQKKKGRKSFKKISVEQEVKDVQLLKSFAMIRSCLVALLIAQVLGIIFLSLLH